MEDERVFVPRTSAGGAVDKARVGKWLTSVLCDAPRWMETTKNGRTTFEIHVSRSFRGFSTCEPVRQAVAARIQRPVVQPRRVTWTSCRPTVGVVAAAAPEVLEPASVDRSLEAVSKLRSVRMSPSKVRRVLDQVRGRSYEEALMILEFMPYRACDEVLKCLYSASANAKNNLDMEKSTLYISHASCDEGPTLKRFRPRAQGRGFPIRKRTCNITIKVAQK